jgi:hypothetical protein
VELNRSPLGIKDATFAKAETLLHGHSFVQTIDSFSSHHIKQKGVLLT